MTRSTRNQPFCWQEKKVLRLIQKHFKKSQLSKMLLLYQTITWIDSDFNGKEIKYYTKTISTYSGLSTEFIPKGLKWLEEKGVLRLEQETKKGRFVNKKLVFTPENITEMPQKTVTGKSSKGKTVTGKPDTSEDILSLEDSFCIEEKEAQARKTDEEKELRDKFKDLTIERLEFEIGQIKKEMVYVEDYDEDSKQERWLKVLTDLKAEKEEKALIKKIGKKHFDLLSENKKDFPRLGAEKLELFFDWLEYKHKVKRQNYSSFKKGLLIVAKKMLQHKVKDIEQALEAAYIGRYDGLFIKTQKNGQSTRKDKHLVTAEQQARTFERLRRSDLFQ